MFEATVDIRPEITLPDYGSVHIEAPSTEVTDEDIDEQLEQLRDRFADEWRAERLSPEAEQIAEELALERGGPWRSLLESETFRMLLEEPPLLRRAA